MAQSDALFLKKVFLLMSPTVRTWKILEVDLQKIQKQNVFPLIFEVIQCCGK